MQIDRTETSISMQFATASRVQFRQKPSPILRCICQRRIHCIERFGYKRRDDRPAELLRLDQRIFEMFAKALVGLERALRHALFQSSRVRLSKPGMVATVRADDRSRQSLRAGVTKSRAAWHRQRSGWLFQKAIPAGETTMKLTGKFDTRREAEMTVERLVQQFNIDRAKVLVAPDGAANSAGTEDAGADAAAGTSSQETRDDAALNGRVVVTVDVADDATADEVRSAFNEFDASA
ncbi:hypothetical protein U1763_16380 [Sphingomonas sp. LB2R24]